MQNNKPEIIAIEDQQFGSHVEHWSLLTENPTQTVPQWLGQALDQPDMPMGLCQQESEIDPTSWLILGPKNSMIQSAQVIAVENNQPRAVKTAFPTLSSPYKTTATIDRIICSRSGSQAVLSLNINHSTLYAFDSLYSVNKNQYQAQQKYAVALSAWAYALEVVDANEHIVVDDPASIKHHRALNAILAANDGVAPDNLQEQIDAWQPQSEEDKAPLKVDFSKMVAYLHGETLGQEDEAWFQGKIVGKSTTTFKEQSYTLYDVTILLEDNAEATLIRVATQHLNDQNYQIGQYIRGNVWIMANIYSTIK
ncbi:hypothetical protein [Acinetobacter rathckeae]|uniref:hypothetical protein n=1 Tax=Acinetobacter rathckeae TaxID=2605272 RepID=UPI0018A31F05|nr:hypothetical protein [Acinetobacter rathckeae]MBF7687499.1 hypothetical protein [Acinetobacter rathckeae]MBF7694900.1 hypothetical protein [Acinetobacter rathckeae]